MDFGFYYVPEKNRVLFHFRPDDPSKSPCCYDTVVSESRIVDYIGIGRGQLPEKEYFGRWRSFPDTCEYAFQETKPVGVWRQYYGVDVFEGAYEYNGTRLVPSWGGSMWSMRGGLRGAGSGRPPVCCQPRPQRRSGRAEKTPS